MQYDTRFSARAKHISIKIEFPSQVVVVAPKKTSPKKIKNFVQNQTDWIKKNLKKIKQKHARIESNSQILILGTKYQKKYIFDQQQPLRIFVKNQQLFFNYPQLNSEARSQYSNKTIPSSAAIKKDLEIFLKKIGRRYLRQKTKNLAQKINVSYSKINLRNQKTRWGSCSGKKTISLNWRLVHYPTQIIDYVIIHELTHLIHPNHSKKFWQQVAQFDPDYKQHRSYLKKYGVTFN